jgi:hypothetical protein
MTAHLAGATSRDRQKETTMSNKTKAAKDEPETHEEKEAKEQPAQPTTMPRRDQPRAPGDREPLWPEGPEPPK